MVSSFDTLIDLVNGETTVIYGQPMVGKTMATVVLARYLHDTTGKPAFLIWSDANLIGEYGNFLKEVSKATVKYVTKPRDLEITLRGIKNQFASQEEKPYSMVVIDSITGFQEAIMSREGIDSPRTALLLGRLSQLVTRELREISAYYGIPTIMIAHQTAIFKPDSPHLGAFAGKSRKPTIVTKALRNVTLLIYQYIDPEKQKPKWLIEDIRSSRAKVDKFPKGSEFILEIKVR